MLRTVLMILAVVLVVVLLGMLVFGSSRTSGSTSEKALVFVDKDQSSTATSQSSTVTQYTFQSSGGRTQVRNAATGVLMAELDQHRFYRATILRDGSLRFLYQTYNAANATAIAFENPHRHAFTYAYPTGGGSTGSGEGSTSLTPYVTVPWAPDRLTLTVSVNASAAPVFYSVNWEGQTKLYGPDDTVRGMMSVGSSTTAIVSGPTLGIVSSPSGNGSTTLNWVFETPTSWQLKTNAGQGTVAVPTTGWATGGETGLLVVPVSEGSQFYHIYIMAL